MEQKHIKELSDKYWDANTNTVEEEELKQADHLTNGLASDESEYFEMLHAFAEKELGSDFDNELLAKIEENDSKKEQSTWKSGWWRAAAIAVVATGIALSMGYRSYEQQQLAEKKAAREAFETTKAMLMMVSARLDRGTTHTINSLNKMGAVRAKVYNYNDQRN